MNRTVALLFVLATLAPAFALELHNAGFENSKKSREGFNGWFFSDESACDLDTETVHSGKFSCRMTLTDNMTLKPHRFWSDYVLLLSPEKRLKADTVYTFKAWIKTELTRGFAGLAVLPRKKKMAYNDWEPQKFLPLHGKNDWVEVAFTFRTPKEECSRIDLMTAGEGFRGKIWVDDLSIVEGVELPTVPNSSSFDKALTLKNFFLCGDDALKRRMPKAQTEIKIISDGRNMRIMGICEEPEMNKLQASVTGHDVDVWKDDRVEIFLDAQRSGSSYYHFAVAAGGGLYDAEGKNRLWNCKDVQVKTEKRIDAWTFELTIPYTSIGYGDIEAGNGNKQMSLNVFRLRRAEPERSSWVIWSDPLFHTPSQFFPITVGVDCAASSYDFATRNPEGETVRPPLAFVTENPLYEELMGNQPMHKEGDPVGLCDFGRMARGRSGQTAFALQHGMKYRFSEIMDLSRSMRLAVTNDISDKGEDQIMKLMKKYNMKYAVSSYLQYAGANRCYSVVPDAPYIARTERTWFYPDPEVQKSYEAQAEKLLTLHKDKIFYFALGHEGRNLYTSGMYDEIREMYLKEKPERWAAFEREAKKEFGAGKIGFPNSYASATPQERMVYQKFVLSRCAAGLHKLTERLKKIAKDVKFVSELVPNGVNPDYYDLYPGTYDYVCQQMDWGGGANRQSIAYNCKLLRDLSGSPVMGGPHIEHYFVSLSPMETTEVLSSVFRVGGEALQLWLCDWFGKTQTDYYGAPARTDAIRHVFVEYAKMRKLKFPEADCAVFYCNEDLLTRGWYQCNGINFGHEQVFTVLGPRVHSWFRFVSEIQMDRDPEIFSAFKAVYDPGAVHVGDRTYGCLKEYVRNGGTLIVGDPEAYSMNTDGTPRATDDFLGLKIDGTLTAPERIALHPLPGFPNMKPLSLPSAGTAKHLKLNESARILGEFANGKPAILVNPYGKGKVITFAAQPFNDSIYSSAPWHEFFKRLQKDIGCKVDRDIWRFRFPNPPAYTVKPYTEGQVCLTGNCCYWDQDQPKEGPNVNKPFQVIYPKAPDLIQDSTDQSKLFNRKVSLSAAYLSGVGNTADPAKLNKALHPWVVAWNTPVEAEFKLKFKEKVKANQLKLWLHGVCTEITLSVDGKEIAKATPKASDPPDVPEIALDFPAVAADTFHIVLKKPSGKTLYLGEAELWGPKEK